MTEMTAHIQASTMATSTGGELRVLLTSCLGRSDQLYGSERSLVLLASGLRERDEVSCAVAAAGGGALQRHLERRGIDFIPVPLEAYEVTPLRKIVDSSRGVLALRRAIRSFRPDIIHANELAANQVSIIASVGTGTPVVCSIRLVYTQQKFWWWNLAPFSAVWLPVSGAAARAFGSAMRSDKTRVIHDPLERPSKVTVGQTEALRTALSIPPGALMLLAVGWMSPVKGQDILIRALARASRSRDDLFLVFVGAFGNGDVLSPYEQTLLRLVDEHDLRGRVVFAGYSDDMDVFYAASDMCIQASRSECFPRALAEAMAHGLPCIGSRVGGIPEMIEDGITGLLVPPEDPQALAEAIRWLVEHPAERAEMGRRGRERARLFDVRTIAGQLEAIYREVLNG